MMETKQVTLKIHIEGSAISAGHIRLRDLILLGQELQIAFKNVASLTTQAKVSKRDLEVATSLEVSAIEKGNFSLTLNLVQSEPNTLGEQALESLVKGLEVLSDRYRQLPESYNKRVLNSWYQIGRLFNQDIERITFDLAIEERRIQVIYGLDLYSIISEKISDLNQEELDYSFTNKLNFALVEPSSQENLNYPLADEIDEKLWLFAASRNSVFDDLYDSEEDIYSLNDGKPFHD